MKTTTIVTTAIAGLALAACTTPRDEFVEAGATQLSGTEVLDLLKGNTLQGDDFLVYYADGGDKIAKLGDDRVVFRTWRVSDGGEFCETLVGSGREVCSPQHFVLNDERKAFPPNGQAIDYAIVSGNQIGIDRLTDAQIVAAFTDVQEDYVARDAPGVTAIANFSADKSFDARWQSRNSSGELTGTWYVQDGQRCIQFDERLGSGPNPECIRIYATGGPGEYTSVWPDGRVHGLHTLSPLN